MLNIKKLSHSCYKNSRDNRNVETELRITILYQLREVDTETTCD